MALLHTHGGAEAGILAFLEEVLLHGVIDTLKLIPFLFLTYLLMEYIEHRAEEKTEEAARLLGLKKKDDGSK